MAGAITRGAISLEDITYVRQRDVLQEIERRNTTLSILKVVTVAQVIQTIAWLIFVGMLPPISTVAFVALVGISALNGLAMTGLLHVTLRLHQQQRELTMALVDAERVETGLRQFRDLYC